MTLRRDNSIQLVQATAYSRDDDSADAQVPHASQQLQSLGAQQLEQPPQPQLKQLLQPLQLPQLPQPQLIGSETSECPMTTPS